MPRKKVLKMKYEQPTTQDVTHIVLVLVHMNTRYNGCTHTHTHIYMYTCVLNTHTHKHSIYMCKGFLATLFLRKRELEDRTGMFLATAFV